MDICKDIKDLESHVFNDGDIRLIVSELYNTDFKKERDLAKYIEANIFDFATDVLDDTLKEYKFNYSILPRLRLSPKSREVDLLVEGENFLHIVELKNPKYQSENRGGIGQILDYGREFTGHKKLYLITTKFDINTAKTIKYYNLPINYIYMSKSLMMQYKGEF